MLPQHPVYRKLDAAVTVLGVDLEDWFGLGAAFIVFSRMSELVVGTLLGVPRAEAVVSALATGLVFILCVACANALRAILCDTSSAFSRNQKHTS